MNVLHVTPSMNPKTGGVCQAVHTMMKGLSGINISSEVVCLDAPDALLLRNSPSPVHAIGPWKGPWLYSPNLLPWLTENLGRFDRVIVHGMWQYHAYAVHKACRLLKRQNGKMVPKLFVMPHGMLDPYFQRASDRKLKALRNQLYWRLIERNIINTADGLFFTCEAERRLAAEPFSPYTPRCENVVGLGVEEPPAYQPQMQTAFLQKCPQVKAQTYLLFLGRIDKKKGVELLIKGYANVYREAEIPPLVIAGPGLDTSYGKEMQQLAATLEINSRVFFPGMLTGDAKWGAYYGCEAFALASHQENFGVAVVEAMACGKPVLISNQININPEIESAGAGVVGEDNVEGTTAMLQKWNDMSQEAKALMGDNASAAFKKHFAVLPASGKLLKALSPA